MANRVLFISGRCPHSKKVLLGIHQHTFLKDIFKIVNIDVHPYPNYIKTVPCILINNQVVSGTKVFEYFGKIVESKMAQEEREKEDTLTEQDQGVCKINEEGMLEGYCGDIGGSMGAMISEENDDFTKKRHSPETNYDFLEGSDNSNVVYQQLKQMEASDDQLGEKRKSFDSDYERMQAERGELMKGAGGMGPGGPGPGPGPGREPSGQQGSPPPMMRR
jgi:hypothetical protein